MSAQVTSSKAGVYRSFGSESSRVAISLKRAQSSRTLYFLSDAVSIIRIGDLSETYFSMESSKSPVGVRSKTIRPGEPTIVGRRSRALEPRWIGMEKMDSAIHAPDSGTSNLCSNQIAVPSFSLLNDSQTCHSEGNCRAAPVVKVSTAKVTAVRKDPCAHRRCCSS
jgi:hypothetical protein